MTKGILLKTSTNDGKNDDIALCFLLENFGYRWMLIKSNADNDLPGVEAAQHTFVDGKRICFLPIGP